VGSPHPLACSAHLAYPGAHVERRPGEARQGIDDPDGQSLRRIDDVHLHTILMLAAVALIWIFVAIVVTVTWLQRQGRLGTPDRQIPFGAYGPVLAGALSGGAAAIHLTVIGEHALRTGAGPALNAGAFLCSIGAGSAHFATVDASIAGYLPLGIVSIGTVGLQGALAIPRAWRNGILAAAGLVVSLLSIGISLVPRLTGVPDSAGSVAVTSVAYSDVLAIVLEVALIGVVGLLVARRPRRLLDRLQVKVADAWVGTALGVAAVAVFTVAAVFAGHAAH